MNISIPSNSPAIFAFAIVSLLFSCKPDLKVNAPYEEIPVVYGLLNQKDSVQYVKITKAFLGEADAYEMAKVRDSSDYGENLDVRLQEIKGNSVRDLKVIRTEVTREGASIFSQKQMVYKIETPSSAPLLSDAKYRLIANNKTTGKEIIAETSLIAPFEITNPSSTPQRSLSFMSAGKLSDFYVQWVSGKNGMRYSIKVVFNYLEVDHSNANAPDTTKHSFDWSYNNIKANSKIGGEKLDVKISGADLLNRIASKIQPSDHLERLLYNMDFYFDVAGEELNTYMDINEPTTGIVMERPEYTNVAGGIGVFSSRLTAQVLGKAFTRETSKEIKNNELTFGRGFKKFYDAGQMQFFCIEPEGANCK